MLFDDKKNSLIVAKNCLVKIKENFDIDDLEQL